MNRLQNYNTNPIRMPPQLCRKYKIFQGHLQTPLPLKGCKTFFMQVTGTFIFYARAMNSTMLPDLSSIASEQNPPTNNTMKRFKQFLNDAASQEEEIITFNASGMVPEIHSNAS